MSPDSLSLAHVDVREYAIAAHGEQKYGDQPYVTHLDQVWGVLLQHGYSTEFHRRVAYLHDVLEDTSLTPEELAEQCGKDTATAVQFCTDEPGHNRKTRKAATYARCRATITTWQETVRTPEGRAASTSNLETIPTAVRVKVADRVANLRAARREGSGLLQMYRKEAEAFRAAYFVAGFCGSLWDEYQTLL